MKSFYEILWWLRSSTLSDLSAPAVDWAREATPSSPMLVMVKCGGARAWAGAAGRPDTERAARAGAREG